MNVRKKIFNAFEINNSIPISDNSLSNKNDLYSFDDPFDFYRTTIDSKRYMPKTQKGLRRAFSEGIIGIELFIVMATSLRPLVDEAQDIDEITRLFSQQKLSSRPNPHSVNILKNMIKDPNPEIALYAAEGLNTIENSFIEKILRIKDRISRKKGKLYILYYILGMLYIEFAKLLKGQPLIKEFYLKESLNCLKKANDLNNNNYRILQTLGEGYILLKKYKTAIRIFAYLSSKSRKDVAYLFTMAECCYYLGDYKNVSKISNFIIKSSLKIDQISELIMYQWLL